MYCRNCGNKMDVNDKFCKDCGTQVVSKVSNDSNIIYSTLQTKKTTNTKAIISIIIAIFGLIYSLLACSSIDYVIEESMPYRDEIFAYAFGAVLVQLILGTVSLLLAVSERENLKSKINMVGIILSAIIFAVCIITFLLIVMA